MTKYGLKQNDINIIISILKKYSEVEKAIIYGSRAKGNFKLGSDIDLTIIGESISLSILSRIESDFYYSPLIYKIDLSVFNQIENTDLVAHIKRCGMLFYTKHS